MHSFCRSLKTNESHLRLLIPPSSRSVICSKEKNKLTVRTYGKRICTIHACIDAPTGRQRDRLGCVGVWSTGRCVVRVSFGFPDGRVNRRSRRSCETIFSHDRLSTRTNRTIITWRLSSHQSRAVETCNCWHRSLDSLPYIWLIVPLITPHALREAAPLIRIA